MKQSKKMSAIETSFSTMVGFIVSWLLVYYAMPLWDFHPSGSEATGVVMMHTVASLLRGYIVRRLFNRKG